VVVTLHNYRLLCLPAVFLRDGRACEDCMGKFPWRGVVHRCYRGSAAGSAALAASLGVHRRMGTFAHVAMFLAVSEFVSRKHVEAGFDPARIYLHGNAKSAAELREALQAGVGHIVVDSLDEIGRLERIAAELEHEQEVLVRVTPGVAGDTHRAISTGQADSKFGFSLQSARAAIERLRRSRHLRMVGLIRPSL